MNIKVQHLLKTLGPGILFASTAIGVSHLVQSTRAGANFGFGLLWAVILANLFKYPFFEYGSRYANVTGHSIIDGYKKIGNWMIWLYFLITLVSMFFVCSAVGFVTAGFLDNLFGLANHINILTTTAILFSICVIILFFGKYNLLDGLIKIIGSVLLVTTIIAFILTLANGPVEKAEGFIPPEIWDGAGIGFLIALMGWMPTAVDLSAWNSLWTIERIKQTGYKPTLKETLFDFNLGYIVSSVLAICFIFLGAYLMYGSGMVFSESGAKFANQVVELYTQTIGSWSRIIIASAAFSIMFGTCIAVFDGYARALKRTLEILFFNTKEKKSIYNIALILIGLGAFFIIYVFHNQPKGFKALIDLATTISFLIAPVIAVVNFRLVSKKYIPSIYRPPLWLRVLSYFGIVFLVVFTIVYVYSIV